MTTKELLLKAADHLDKVGHAKGVSVAQDGRCCLVGALQYVWDRYCRNLAPLTSSTGIGNSTFPRDYESAVRAVSVTLGTYDLIRWNDEPARTKEEVVALLKKAADAFDLAKCELTLALHRCGCK